MDCTWPLAFAIPGKPPAWKALGTASDETGGIRTRIEEGANEIYELRRRVADFFVVKDPGSQPQRSFVDDVLKPYAQLVRAATLHLDCGSLGAGGKGKSQATVVEFKDAWTYEDRKASAVIVEVAWTLHNIAASLSIIGSQSVAAGTADACKTAFQTFQEAAGYVKLLREAVMPAMPTGEQVGMFLPESIEFCENVLLANAAHAFVLRASLQDGAKPSLMSKLYRDVGDAYHRIASTASLHGPKARSFIAVQTFARTASEVCLCRCNAYTAEVYKEKEEFGPAIAHLQVSLATLTDPGKDGSPALAGWIRAEAVRVRDLHARAVKRNETVYFDRIPPTVPQPEGFGKIKAAAAAVGPMAKVGGRENPFASVVPRHAADTAKTFRSTMASQLEKRQHEALAHRANVSQTLGQLGVSGIISTLTGDSEAQCKVPDSLRQRVLGLRGEGADPEGEGQLIARLVDLVAHIHQVSESAKVHCDETTQELDAEIEEDKTFCASFGDRVWRPLRKPSNELPDVAKLRAMVKEVRARINTGVVQRVVEAKTTLESHSAAIARLDWPVSELDALMPYRESSQAVQSRGDLTGAAMQLAKLVARIEETVQVETARFSAIQAFISSPRVAQALTAAGADHEDEVLDRLQAEVIDHYAVISSAVDSRDTLLAEIEDVMVDVAAKRSEDPVAAEVQRVCSEIEKAVELYQASAAGLEAIANDAGIVLEEATLMRNSARAIRHARKVEADEFAESLEQEVARRVAAMQGSGPEGLSAQQLESRRRQDELQAEIARLEGQRNGGQLQQQQQQQPPSAPVSRQPTDNDLFGGAQGRQGSGAPAAQPDVFNAPAASNDYSYQPPQQQQQHYYPPPPPPQQQQQHYQQQPPYSQAPPPPQQHQYQHHQQQQQQVPPPPGPPPAASGDYDAFFR